MGEEGPEIVNLPRGSQVIPADASKAIANSTRSSGVGGGGEIAPIVLQMDGRTVWRGLVELKRTNGGRALGLT